ncbi:MAG: hypothetical protein V1798_06305 [Pseudomonadota bacterium]
MSKFRDILFVGATLVLVGFASSAFSQGTRVPTKSGFSARDTFDLPRLRRETARMNQEAVKLTGRLNRVNEEGRLVERQTQFLANLSQIDELITACVVEFVDTEFHYTDTRPDKFLLESVEVDERVKEINPKAFARRFEGSVFGHDAHGWISAYSGNGRFPKAKPEFTRWQMGCSPGNLMIDVKDAPLQGSNKPLLVSLQGPDVELNLWQGLVVEAAPKLINYNRLAQKGLSAFRRAPACVIRDPRTGDSVPTISENAVVAKYQRSWAPRKILDRSYRHLLTFEINPYGLEGAIKDDDLMLVPWTTVEFATDLNDAKLWNLAAGSGCQELLASGLFDWTKTLRTWGRD